MNRLLADQSVRGRKWSRLQRDIAHVLWPSFIAASAASLFFFAIFDPAQLVAGTALGVAMGLPHAGYTLGFFFFGLSPPYPRCCRYISHTPNLYPHDPGLTLLRMSPLTHCYDRIHCPPHRTAASRFTVR